MDQNRNELEKACSRSNFKERFVAIDSLEPGEFNLRGHIIRKIFENFFYFYSSRWPLTIKLFYYVLSINIHVYVYLRCST